jgi:hypothetical protein
MSAPVMPKCCCCSVKVGLLIWIVIGLAFNGFGLVNRNVGVGNYGLATNGFGLAFGIVGFYSVYAEKRVLVKVYSIILVFLLLASTALSIFLMYSSIGTELYREAFDQFSRAYPDSSYDNEDFLQTAQITVWAGIALTFIIEVITLGFLYKYYRYLAQKELKSVENHI